MVPTRFAWPYGGRHVFVSGSFNGWAGHVPLTPVEGSTTVFQTVYHLPPGFHQYKFLVDGRWQHDPQKPSVTDNYGIVNNIIHVREPEVTPLVMDVDHVSRDTEAPLTGGIQLEPEAQHLDVDLNDLLHHLSAFLSRYTAYELLPDSGRVFAVDINLSVKRAFHIMYEQGLAVMPLWDENVGQISGMLTASDFIMILRELHTHGSLLTSEELETHTISAWKDFKVRFRGDANWTRRPVIQAGPYESLRDVAMKIVQNEISAVPIVHSSMQDGSSQQLLHLACLPDILKYICRHFRHSHESFPLLQQPIYRIPLGTWVPDIGRANQRPLTMLRPNSPLSTALNLLIEAGVSSIPIIDENGLLLDVYSRSDITTLANGGAYAQIQLDQTSMHRVIQLGYQANGATNGRQRFYTCLRSDTFYNILERLSDPVVRRLVVIEPQTQRVEGIISLRDVFKLLLG